STGVHTQAGLSTAGTVGRIGAWKAQCNLLELLVACADFPAGHVAPCSIHARMRAISSRDSLSFPGGIVSSVSSPATKRNSRLSMGLPATSTGPLLPPLRAAAPSSRRKPDFCLV